MKIAFKETQSQNWQTLLIFQIGFNVFLLIPLHDISSLYSIIIHSLTNWTRHEEKVLPQADRDMVTYLLFEKEKNLLFSGNVKKYFTYQIKKTTKYIMQKIKCQFFQIYVSYFYITDLVTKQYNIYKSTGTTLQPDSFRRARAQDAKTKPVDCDSLHKAEVARTHDTVDVPQIVLGQ